MLDYLINKFEKWVHNHTMNHFPDDRVEWRGINRVSHCKFCPDHREIIEMSDGSWIDPEYPMKGLIERKEDRNHKGII